MSTSTLIPLSDLSIPRDMLKTLTKRGITEAFDIQAATIPDALAGRDVCGKAPTGCGKTLAFSIPIAVLAKEASPNRPTALILVPTRELATQVTEVLAPLAQAQDRFVATFYGGTSVRRDIQRLRRGVDIAVATPGRLADLVEQGEFILSDVDLIAIDEADRMADMGFLPEVKRILDKTSDDRQVLLFSATLDGDVRVLINRYQNDPVTHEVESNEIRGEVRHLFMDVDRGQRRQFTAELLNACGTSIVFTRTKHGANRLAKQLADDGVSTAAIHGNRSQRQRETALRQFSHGRVQALIATDVAARGIHVDGVDLVLHYDIPATHKDYVHRSGRTGRAGADGLVVALVHNQTAKDAKTIQKKLDMPVGFYEPDLDLLELEKLDLPSKTRIAPSKGDDDAEDRDNRRGGQRNGQRNGGGRNGSGNRNRNDRNRRDRNDRDGDGGDDRKKSSSRKSGAKNWGNDNRDSEKSGGKGGDRKRSNKRSKGASSWGDNKSSSNPSSSNDNGSDRDGDSRAERSSDGNRSKRSGSGGRSRGPNGQRRSSGSGEGRGNGPSKRRGNGKRPGSKNAKPRSHQGARRQNAR